MNCKALPNDLDPEYRDVKTQKQSPSTLVRSAADSGHDLLHRVTNDAKAACLH